MAREKFKTLTEQMFYVLLVLQQECYGADIMTQVDAITGGRVRIGGGTLYTLLDSFQEGNFIKETRTDGRKRCYQLTKIGRDALIAEQHRMRTVLSDWDSHWKLEEEDQP